MASETAFASEKRDAMGSVVEIKLPEENRDLFPPCFSEIARIEQEYSRFIPDSELSRANKNLGEWQDASPEFLSLLKTALFFSKETRGNFDITLKSELERLGYDSEYTFSEKMPEQGRFFRKSLSRLLRPVLVDEKTGKILLREEIDFGGFGKGYAIDRVSSLLSRQGVSNFYVNAGGDVYAKGSPPWTILLEHPDDPKRAIGKAEIDGIAIACSASNRRRWGNGAHHLLNPNTGLPENSMKAVFVLGKTAIEADALATALFASGFSNAINLQKSLHAEILAISRENRFFSSPGFSAELFSD